MSRVGKLPISIADKVQVNISDLLVKIEGPKGYLEKEFFGDICIKLLNDHVVVEPTNNSTSAKAMWGTVRSIINNMIIGVTDGFKTELEVNGVGYRASVKGQYLNLTLGKSHNTKMEIPEGIKIETPKQTIILLESHDKQRLGSYVAKIKNQRPPEPYKGKGIKVKGEYIQRKESKKS